MKSIIERLNTEEFSRLRIGIGRPTQYDPTNWVLGRFSSTEKEQMQATVNKAVDAVDTWITAGLTEAMNAYN
jgi:PTH1 family peptidyl-tRNA hydrolase